MYNSKIDSSAQVRPCEMKERDDILSLVILRNMSIYQKIMRALKFISHSLAIYEYRQDFVSIHTIHFDVALTLSSSREVEVEKGSKRRNQKKLKIFLLSS